jgi:hypothetical protein
MVDARKNEIVNSSEASRFQSAETEEVLLADLILTEDADLMFKGLADSNTDREVSLEQLKKNIVANAEVTGGDLDDNLYQAEVVGEEAVGGQTPTPDQNVTEDLLQAMGVASVDGEPVHTREKLERRDRVRWELDPLSSEDYRELGDENTQYR